MKVLKMLDSTDYSYVWFSAGYDNRLINKSERKIRIINRAQGYETPGLYRIKSQSDHEKCCICNVEPVHSKFPEFDKIEGLRLSSNVSFFALNDDCEIMTTDYNFNNYVCVDGCAVRVSSDELPISQFDRSEPVRTFSSLEQFINGLDFVIAVDEKFYDRKANKLIHSVTCPYKFGPDLYETVMELRNKYKTRLVDIVPIETALETHDIVALHQPVSVKRGEDVLFCNGEAPYLNTILDCDDEDVCFMSEYGRTHYRTNQFIFCKIDAA